METTVRVHASPAYDLLVSMNAIVQGQRYPYHREIFQAMTARCDAQLMAGVESLVAAKGCLVFSSVIPELGKEPGRPTVDEFLAGLANLSAPRLLRTLLTLHSTEPSAPVRDRDFLAMVGSAAAAMTFLDRYTATDVRDDRYRRLVMEAVLDPAGTCTRLARTMAAFYRVAFAPVEQELVARQQEGARQLAALLAREGRTLLTDLTFTDDPNRAGFSSVVLVPTALGGNHTYQYLHETETPLDEQRVQDALLGVAEPWVYEPYIILVGLDWIERRAVQTQMPGTAQETWTLEAAAAIFSLLGDVSRLAVIRRLRDRPYYVQELAQELELSPATVHHHLVTLSHAGLVELKRVQHRVYYFLQTERLREHLRQGGSFL